MQFVFDSIDEINFFQAVSIVDISLQKNLFKISNTHSGQFVVSKRGHIRASGLGEFGGDAVLKLGISRMAMPSNVAVFANYKCMRNASNSILLGVV